MRVSELPLEGRFQHPEVAVAVDLAKTLLGNQKSRGGKRAGTQ